MSRKSDSDEGVDPDEKSTDEKVATVNHGGEIEHMNEKSSSDDSEPSIDTSAARSTINDGVDALDEPTIRKEIFTNVSIFVGAGVGLGVITFLYIMRLVSLEFTGFSESFASLFLILETYLVLIGILMTVVTTYVLLAGLVGVESGIRFDENLHAIVVGSIASAIGAFLLMMILVLAVGGGFGIMTSVAPPTEALPAAGGGDEITTGQEFNGEEGGLDIGEFSLILLGIFLITAVISSLFFAAIAGVAGGLTAYITRKYTAG